MVINYNDWFYEFHRYLTGSRNGNVSYNDTNYANIQEQLQRLIETHSTLINEQPCGVVGNQYGFERLVQLMEKSGYTFEDINASLTNTYEHSIRQSMSRQLVNTHAIVYHTKRLQSHYASGQYYLIDLPYDQLRFGGERDEFIRQRFQSLNHTDDKRFLDIEEFSLSEYTKILKCAFIVSVNGLICNDVKIGFNDHGLKFHIGYSGSDDAEVIIYKLDNCIVCQSTLSIGQLKLYTDEDGYISIPNVLINVRGDDAKRAAWRHAILNIHGVGFRNVPTIPNFGSFTRDGRLTIAHMQPSTMTELQRAGARDITIVAYVPKYFHEIGSIYPAANYMDMMRTSDVYTDMDNIVKGTNNRKVVTSGSLEALQMDRCTPPICIDRDYDTGFEDVITCCSMRNILMPYKDTSIATLSDAILHGNTKLNSYDQYAINIQPVVKTLHRELLPYYRTYYNGCMLISLTDNESNMQRFTDFMSALFKFGRLTESDFINQGWKQYISRDFYSIWYADMVTQLTAPFVDNEVLSNFIGLNNVIKRFYEDTNPSTQYNQNVSEQCFISLRYSRDRNCWVFTYPSIKHFHGIGNTFYINSELNGDEVFKFFVLYSDNIGCGDTDIDDSYDIETVLDYDKFMTELEKHVGFIRYWHVENKLMKLSKLMYNRYDDETVVNVISKILKRKIDAFELLDDYDSELQYDNGNKTTYGIDTYTETSEQAPFILNVMFYALQTLNGSTDMLQSYFYRTLTNRLFTPRYIDYKMLGVLDDRYLQPVNLSGAVKACDSYDNTKSNYNRSSTRCMYYGLPYVFLNDNVVHIDNLYNWVARSESIQTGDNNYYLINDNGAIDTSYWITPLGLYSHEYVHHYADFVHMITKFICCIRDYMSYLLTNYKTSYDQRIICKQAIKSINEKLNDIKDFYNGLDALAKSHIRNMYNHIVDDYPYETILNHLIDATDDSVKNEHYYGGSVSNPSYTQQQSNWFTSTIKATYLNTGFHENTLYRIRGLYMHFKENNKKQNAFQYKQWLNRNTYDSSFLLNDLYQAYTKSNGTVLPQYNQMKKRATQFISTSDEIIRQSHMAVYDQTMRELEETNTTYLHDMEVYCANTIRDKIYDLYIISEIVGFDYGNGNAYEPAYIVWTATRDAHFNCPSTTNPTSSTVNITLVPVVERDGNSYNYIVSGVRKPCEYFFFDGNEINGCSFKVYDPTGTLIKTVNDITVRFERISSTGCLLNDVKMIPNVGDVNITFENKHEDMSVNTQDDIVNDKHNETHYELLVSNKFNIIDKYSELILNPRTMLQGSQDVLYIDPQKLNRMVFNEYSNIHKPQIYLKPVQVLHVEIDDETLNATSVKGRFTVGQTIYMVPNEYPSYTFGATITAIDHSRSRGMLEAKIDPRSTKWFTIDDNALTAKFMSEPITCTVLDENLSNFLDEYDGTYNMFYNPSFDYDMQYADDDFDGMLSVPGDPIFVQNNAEYVYTRLSWMFPAEVQNRFIDDAHKQWNFRYVGASKMDDAEHNSIYISCVNHNWSTLSLSQLYPILRSEPNDHTVWDKEIQTYNEIIHDQYEPRLSQIMALYQTAQYNYEHAKTDYKRKQYSLEMASLMDKYNMVMSDIKRLKSYIDEQEHDTTWYNVDSYDAAMKYIQNGHAKPLSTYIPGIFDMEYTDSCNLLLYDWEHKQWIDPSTYDVIKNGMDEYSTTDRIWDYTTYFVLRFLRIRALNGFPNSKRILIYIAYPTSDVYDSIPINSPECKVRFKPLLSIDKSRRNVDSIYDDVSIRKHIDSGESYSIMKADIVPLDDGSFTQECIHITRDPHSGKLPYTPSVRYKDIVVKQYTWSFDYTNFDLYVRIPFPNTSTFAQTKHHIYDAIISKPINHVIPNETVSLICVQNTPSTNKYFNGNISNITFTGVINDNETSINIIDSSIPLYRSGSFVTTIPHSYKYHSNGGLIIVNVNVGSDTIMNDTKQWLHITDPYRLLPNEFVLVPHNMQSLGSTTPITIQFDTTYNSNIDDIVLDDNSNLNNPYEYYFNTQSQHRYPISTMHDNSPTSKRLTIDQQTNPNVQLIKSNHLHVCRYFASHIPSNGFIDVTGFVPTPLSRDRYEFWVNGRYLNNTSNLIILSPTSFQLMNLTSLKNFELIELVDDYNDTALTNKDSVYVASDGTTYSSYTEALQQQSIVQQTLRYTFNTYPHQHTPLQNYSKVYVSNPNNLDLEEDILDGLITTGMIEPDYNEMNHVPTINEVPLYHPILDDFGMIEMDVTDMIPLYDNTYKLEALTDPFFPMTHRDETIIPNNEYLVIHVEHNPDGSFTVYTSGTYHKSFMMYLSTSIIGNIANVNNTQLVIPCVRAGVRIHIPNTYHGLFIHVTMDDYTPMQLL